jgi:hypothetical protein
MDFSTDDNSYRSIQAAADFTSLVQIGLGSEPGIEWVERSKISLVKQELGLAAMHPAGALSPIRRGKMLGADWLVTGHFSSDDQNRATLSVQVIELKYADTIASGTFRLPAEAVGVLRQLFAKARTRQEQAANQARVAFLFLADTSAFGYQPGTDVLPREFSDALERAAVTNRQIRLIHFPKAYQSTDESEMILDGIIEAGSGAWGQNADLYVWGTYAVTNARVAERFESRLDVVLYLWDGVSQPTVLKNSLNMAARATVPPRQLSDLISRLVGQIVAGARAQLNERDSATFRQQIADSIVKAYVAMAGRMGSHLALVDRAKWVQAVQMLETACFFDPGNAEARMLWMTCRYGRWMDFGFNVKNQFWTNWRRSQAWANYVDRFGLKPVGVRLPFPYEQQGLPAAYLRSSEEVIDLCPQDFEWSEAEPHGPMKEAQFHGFPKEISNVTAAKWKSELQAEHWKRLTKVVEFIKNGGWTLPDKMPPTVLSDRVRGILGGSETPSARLVLLEEIWPECAQCAERFGREWILGAGALATEKAEALVNLCALAGKPARADQLLALLLQREFRAGTNAIPDDTRNRSNKTRAATSPISFSGENHSAPKQNPVTAPAKNFQTPSPPPKNPQRVPVPEWLKNYMAISSMFRLYPPNALLNEVKPDVRRIQFPSRFEVKVIKQMAYHKNQLWIDPGWHRIGLE